MSRIFVSSCLLVNTVQAQWISVNDAEVCVAGTGIDLLDIEICGRAIRWGKGDLSAVSWATLYSARGRAYIGRGEFQRAVADLDAALRLNPLSANAYNSRGAVRHAQGEFELAVEDYGRAIELFPNYAEAHRNRGRSYHFLSNLDRAVVDYGVATSLNPWDPEPVALRGMVHYQSGRYARAAADFEHVERMGFPYKYLALWRYLAAQRIQRDAREVLSKAASWLDSGEWPAPLVAAYLDLEPAELAITAARESPEATRAVRSSEANYYLGELALLRGDRERAVELFRASLAARATLSVEQLMADAALQRLQK
ncbi:MAG: tetratricopeptide repeat protein [Gammaproteobacteria bacterium]|nr:tetratricopeptide repeat protein [Gammaproteobacteria bacterium]